MTTIKQSQKQQEDEVQGQQNKLILESEQVMFSTMENCLMRLMDAMKKNSDQSFDPLILKYYKTTLALTIYALNGDSKGYEKRLPKFKKHQQDALECMMEGCDGVKIAIINGENGECESSVYRNEGALKMFADALKIEYDTFTGVPIRDVIAKPAWKVYRQPQ
jgi:hypothetical protein